MHSEQTKQANWVWIRYLIATGFLLISWNTVVLAQSVPQFHPAPGFYEAPILVSIWTSDADTIYYTLDGSIPTAHSHLYTASISVDDRADDEPVIAYRSDISHNYSPWVPPSGPVQLVTVIRARAKKGDSWSPVITHTYVVHPDGRARYTLPIVSLSTDPHHLFDYQTGIYVRGAVYDAYKQANPGSTDGISTPANYTQRGDAWERPAHIEFFESHGDRAVAMDIGIRLHGGGSRQFQQKSFRLYSRSEYGTSRFRYPFFTDQDLDNYNRLLLRNSGQDWMKTALRDGFMQTLVRDMPFETMAFRQSVLFLNGEFWGIANIRERYDKDYISIKYDISEDQIDYLTGNRSVVEGSATHYTAMLNEIAAGGLATPERFIWLQTQMDTESFLYYNLANIYVNNRDWPHNNIDYFRRNTPYNPDAGPGRDGRWRWMMFDTDFGFAWTDRHRETTYQSHVTQDLLKHATRYGHWSTFLLHEMLKNEGFRSDFINTYRDLMNSTFSSSRVLHVLDSLAAVIAPVITEHVDRWGHSDHRWSMPVDADEWNTNLEYMRRFAREREENTDAHFAEAFGLDGLYPIQAGVNDAAMGYIRVHRLDLRPGTPGAGPMEYPDVWTGRYFTGNPVQVTAISYEGYQFSHWLYDQSDDQTFTIAGVSDPIVAVFAAEGTVSARLPENETAEGMRLYSNYPNPFNPETQVRFFVPDGGLYQLDVLDITGRVVKTVFNGTLAAGHHQHMVRMDVYATGLYIVRLRSATGEQRLHTITLIK